MAAGDGGHHFLVELISAFDVPKSDVIGHSDPYLVAWICQPPAGSTFGKLGEALVPEETESQLLSSDSPLLGSPGAFGHTPAASSPEVAGAAPTTGRRKLMTSIRGKLSFKSTMAFTEKDLDEMRALKRGEEIRTERMFVQKDPIWHCVRDFQITPQGTEVMILVLYDWDATNKDDLLGAVAVPLSLFLEYRPFKVSFSLFIKQSRGLGTCSLKLSGIPTPHPFPTRKTLFLIRHGESRWNQAQGSHNVVGMVKTVDHGLNSVGIEQAQRFNAKWKTASRESPDHPRLKQFLEAGSAFASPLTRATQTALLTLKDHPVHERSKVILFPSMREAKNLGGLDTIGKKVGEEIPERVKTEFSSVLGEEAVSALGIKGLISGAIPSSGDLNLDIRRCTQPWWTPKGIKEGNKVLARRMFDFITTINLSRPQDQSVICVGHSLFFKEFVKTYLSESFAQANPEFAAKLRAHKLGNAACLAVDIEFSSDPKNPLSIVAAELMFDSDFHYE